MAIPRLYLHTPMQENIELQLDKEQSHYLFSVMRLKQGGRLRVFNGKDGEFLATITLADRKNGSIALTEQTRKQPIHDEPDIWLCPAVIKNTPMSTIIRMATELGAELIQPIITSYTSSKPSKIERLRMIAIEAAEQSERLSVPQVNEPVALDDLLEGWDENRMILLAAENGSGKPLHDLLTTLPKKTALALLTGPEGGFSQAEFDHLAKRPYITPVGLGPRILKADTAAMTLLACSMSLFGNWEHSPPKA